jgi:N-acetyl-gamma-glutamyl-phosphate reductase
MPQTVPIAIVGAAGYSGAELVERLLQHPRVHIAGLFASAKRDAKPERFDDVFPRFRGLIDLPVSAGTPEAIRASGAQVVFLCTPHEASLELAPALADAGLTVLDLSAAFRLKDASLYPKYYGFEHHQPAHLARAVYGMPEVFRAELKGAKLIAVPGCYTTCSILALRPLYAAGLIAPGTRPIIDAISGVSGAGRSPQVRSLFCEIGVQAYGLLNHRHQPEIDAYCGAGPGGTIFTPHMAPLDRGIAATIHADLREGVSAEQIASVYASAYAREPFVRLCKPGQWPSTQDIRNTNFLDLAFAYDAPRRHVIVGAALDNLVKGAAGQALQAMNASLGFDETTALLPSPRVGQAVS